MMGDELRKSVGFDQFKQEEDSGVAQYSEGDEHMVVMSNGADFVTHPLNRERYDIEDRVVVRDVKCPSCKKHVNEARVLVLDRDRMIVFCCPVCKQFAWCQGRK